MPVGFHIASAWVDIRADASGLKQQAESKIRAALNSLDAKVKLGVDGKGLRAKAEAATKAATAGLEGKVEIKADFDGLSLRRQLQEALSVARTTFNVDINPNIDRDLYRAQVRKLSENVQVKINPDIDRSAYLAQVRQLSENVRVRINPDLDRQAYIAQVMRLSRELEGQVIIPGTLNEMQLQARARAAAQRASNRYTIRFPVDLDRDSVQRTHHRMRRLTAIILASVAFTAPALSVTAQAIENVGAAAAVAVPIFLSLGTMVAAAVVGFEGMGKALGRVNDPLGVFLETTEGLAPNATEFLFAIRDMGGALKEMRLDVQNTLFENMASAIRGLGQTAIPDLRVGLGGMAEVLNEMGLHATKTLTKLSEMGTLRAMFGGLQLAMEPVTKVPGQLLNALTKLSIAATPLMMRMTTAFGRMADSWTRDLNRAFADGRLQQSISEAGDTIVRFFRNIANNPAWQEFIRQIRESGPRLMEIVGNLAEAILRLHNAAAPIVAVLLEIANAFAQIVNALPQGLITTILATVLAFKAFSKVKGWMMGAAVAIERFSVRASRLAAIPTIINPAATSVRNMGAATGTLASSATAVGITRTTLALRTLGAVGLGLAATFLTFKGIDWVFDSIFGGHQSANVDRLTTSLARFERTSRMTGEGARVLGKDLGEIGNAFRHHLAPSRLEEITHFFDKLDPGSNEWDGFQDDIKKVDQALTNLVNSGNKKAANFFLKRMAEQSGRSIKELKSVLPGYTTALAGSKEAAKAAADAMGLFGQKAIDTKMKLDAQKSTADGLRQSLQALNNVARQAAGGQIGFEAAIDAATAAAKKNGETLDATTGKGRANRQALLNLANQTDQYTAALYDNNATHEQVMAAYERGRGQFIKTARAMGATKEEAVALANEWLRIPTDKRMKIHMESEDAVRGLNSVMSKIKKTPDKKTVTVKSLTDTAVVALNQLGFKVKKLPNGKFEVTARTGTAGKKLDNLKGMINKLKNKKITVTAITLDAIGGLNDVIGKIKKTPGSKSVTVKTLNKAAIAALEKVGFKTKRLPDGSIKVTAKTGTALSNIGAVQRARDALRSKSITLTTRHVNIYTTIRRQVKKYGWGKAAYHAQGGPVRKFANGGHAQSIGGLITGPGTGTSDSIPAMLSDGEFVIRAKAVQKYGLGMLNRLNSGRLMAFAGGGKVGKSGIQSKEGLKALRSHVTLSNESIMAGRWKNELVGNLDAASDLNQLLQNMWETQKKITGAFKGSAQKRLMRQFTNAEEKLIPLQKNLDKVNKELEKQQDVLKDLTQKFDELKGSIKENLVGSANITKVGGQGGSARTIISQLQTDVSRTARFSSQLDQLKAMGLDSAIIRDIAEAGTLEGSRTARALLGASPQQIAQINALQGQLRRHAESAGDTVATAMYGAGIQAAEGLVKGLKDRQDDIQDAMLEIAQSMERALQRALGIRSPSRVMERLAQWVPLGFARGIVRNLSPVRDASRTMAATPVAMTVARTPGASNSGTMTAGGGVVIHNLTIKVDANVDINRPDSATQFAKNLAPAMKEALRGYDKQRR